MNPFMKSKKSSVNLSLSQNRKVRGYEIKRMPIGAYLTALEELKNFPQQALELLFPEMGLDEILDKLKTVDTALIGQLMLRAMASLPQYGVALVAKLTGIPEERLLTDEGIGLDGLAEIVEAWLEVNQIENFILAVRRVLVTTKKAAANTGSKA